MKLTIKQESFCLSFVEKENASEAYRIIYNTEGMTDKSVHEAASRLLNNSKVIARLAELREPVIKKVQLELERVLTENMRIGFSDIRQYFDNNTRLIPVSEWSEDMAGAVSNVKINEVFEHIGNEKILVGKTTEIKFWDKGQALDKLMRHLGAYEKENKDKPNPLIELMKQLQGSALPIANANMIDVEDDDDEY